MALLDACLLADAGVPAGPIYRVDEVTDDAHFQARKLFFRIDRDGLLARLATEKQGLLEPELIVEAALAGDQRAITILSEVGLNLGRGISMLIQLLNPELIIIGGAVAEAKQYLLTPIQQALNIYSMAKSREKTQLALYQLGKDVGLMGGVAVVNEKLFDDVINRLG